MVFTNYEAAAAAAANGRGMANVTGGFHGSGRLRPGMTGTRSAWAPARQDPVASSLATAIRSQSLQ